MAKTTEMVEVAVGLLKPYERNAKKHPQDQIEKIKKSIQEFGFISPCLIDKENRIIAGHGRVQAATQLGMEKVPCIYVEGLTEEQRRAYIIADNRLTELGGWDEDLIAFELHELTVAGFDVEMLGFDTVVEKPQTEPDAEKAYTRLTDRFFVNPFSVLDSRQKWWQDRKRAWKDLGIASEIGRGNDGDVTKDGLTYAKSHVPMNVYKQKNRLEEALGRSVKWDEFYEVFPNAHKMHNTSTFDPVVCEIAYRWYSKPGDSVLDPFAGGSVRGITATLLGRKYAGVDLSEKQIEANKNNWEEISHKTITDGEEAAAPEWFVGDSLKIDEIVTGDQFDLLFTCPPYADLEVYSDDPRDISNMDYSQFCDVYSEIIKKSVAKLRRDAFAVVVVGDVRDRQGFYRDFVSFTIRSFEEAGMKLYNEAILVTSFGSVATVVGRQFANSRKLGKVHQNVLVFADDRDELHEINLDDDEQREKQTAEFIEQQNGKLPRDYVKVLTFSKGDPKKKTEELGDVQVIETFDVEL